jgi:hypothetical protein
VAQVDRLAGVGERNPNWRPVAGVLATEGAGDRAHVRHEPLSAFRWCYEQDVRVKTGFTIVSPYGSEEGIAYDEGRGTATGRIEGTVVWSNYPRRRMDGRMPPNLRGLISTDDGASILFELRGNNL